MTRIGIHDIAMATTKYRLDLPLLAEAQGIDPEKYRIGIGQDSMSFPAADEDIVTLAAAAAQPIIERHGVEGIRTVLLATETGIDQSKAAAVYVHALLGLPHSARAVELKQACYSGTAALQMAAGLIARDPRQRVLVIATDVAKYDLDSSGESTQGAAAVAMLVSADPAIAELEGPSGVHTNDVMDFWRPNYRVTPLVDGKYSVRAYLRAAEGAWLDYRALGGAAFEDFAAHCYHSPFTKMTAKAHKHLIGVSGGQATPAEAEAALADTVVYNRAIGNSYTASLYLGLLSLLDERDDLAGELVGMLSYGSGAVAEFFAVRVVEGYRQHLRTECTRAQIARREPLDVAHYRGLHELRQPSDGGDHTVPVDTAGPFRLAEYSGHQRVYRSR